MRESITTIYNKDPFSNLCRSRAQVWHRCAIDIDSKVFTIWDKISTQHIRVCIIPWKYFADLHLTTFIQTQTSLLKECHDSWMQNRDVLLTKFDYFTWRLSMHSHIWARFLYLNPDSKIHVANMGASWVLSAPGGPHVGPMNLAVSLGTHNHNP